MSRSSIQIRTLNLKATVLPKEQIQPLTVRQLRDAADTFADLARLLQQAIDDITPAGDSLYVFRCDSLRRAIERALAFRIALNQSLMSLHKGQPFGPDTEKNKK